MYDLSVIHHLGRINNSSIINLIIQLEWAA